MSCSGASASKASRGDSDQLDAISNTIDDLNAKIDNPEKLRPSLADAEKRAHARPAAPGLLIQPTKGDFDHPTYSSPWVDRNACELMLADTFATRSVATFQSFVDQIIGLCRKCWDDAPDVGSGRRRAKPSTQLHQRQRPRNEAEAALCLKLYANYQKGIRIAGPSLSGGWVDPKDSYAIASLDRAYAHLWDSLSRGRGRTTRQKIIVKRESHVHHHQHVHLAQGEGPNSGQQSHGDARKNCTASGNPLAVVEPAQRTAAKPGTGRGIHSGTRLREGSESASITAPGPAPERKAQRQLPARRDDH
jgi:hypothetical protein